MLMLIEDIDQPWAYRLVDLVELVKGELLQLNEVSFTIRQTHVGKRLYNHHFHHRRRRHCRHRCDHHPHHHHHLVDHHHHQHLVDHLLSFSRSKSLCKVTDRDQPIDGHHEPEKVIIYAVDDVRDDDAWLYRQITLGGFPDLMILMMLLTMRHSYVYQQIV